MKSDPNKTDLEYTKSDFADRCIYPQIILKLIHSNLSGIQTHDLCLVTGARSLPCKEGKFQVVGFKMIQ